jgi:hypothetical protein
MDFKRFTGDSWSILEVFYNLPATLFKLLHNKTHMNFNFQPLPEIFQNNSGTSETF